MRTAILSSVALLVGCAAQPSVEALAAGSSNVSLCEAVFYAPPHPTVNAEVQRRGLNCADYMQAIQAQQQLRAQAAQNLANQPIVQPYQLPMPVRPTTCTTQRVGNDLRTVCR